MKSRIRKLSLILFIIIIAGIYFAPIIFQEGNPIPIFIGIVKLNTSEDSLVQISHNPDRYISKSSNGREEILGLMKENGWTFTEQGGSGYFFVKDEFKRVVTARQYTRKYVIWH